MFTVAIMLAVVVEAVVEYVKDIRKNSFEVEKAVAIILGLVFAFGARLDLFELAEIDFHIPYVGMIIIGLFIGKGANVVHDLFDKLLQSK